MFLRVGTKNAEPAVVFYSSLVFYALFIIFSFILDLVLTKTVIYFKFRYNCETPRSEFFSMRNELHFSRFKNFKRCFGDFMPF